MSNQRRKQIIELVNQLAEINISKEIKAARQVPILIECIETGQYDLVAVLVEMMPAKSVANAIRAYCGG